MTHMEVGELLPEAARELAMLSAPGGRLPDDVLDYLVAHCEGVCLNIEQMATAFVESELLFLTGAKPNSSRFARIRTRSQRSPAPRVHTAGVLPTSRPTGAAARPRGMLPWPRCAQHVGLPLLPRACRHCRRRRV